MGHSSCAFPRRTLCCARRKASGKASRRPTLRRLQGGDGASIMRPVLVHCGETHMAESTFDKGRKLREEVLGKEHVENSFKNTDEFSRPMQDLTTEVGWGV